MTTRKAAAGWWVPLALVALSAIPLLSGSMRVVELAGGPAVLPANVRISDSPVPAVIHVVAAAPYALLGAFQFSAAVRRRWPRWHRAAGRVLVPVGLAVAGSGLWMTLAYTGAPGGDLLWSVRVLASTAMAASILLGYRAIRRRDVSSHRAWMIRAYALALGAGTQVVTQGLGQGVFGHGELATGASVSAGWVVNALIAERVIRRGRHSRRAVRHPVDVAMPPRTLTDEGATR